MPLHTVTLHGKTKAGKPVVYFDNKHTYKDMIFLGKTAPPPVGALIDTEMTSLPRDDGSQTWFLNKWGLMPANAQPATYALPTAPVQATQTAHQQQNAKADAIYAAGPDVSPAVYTDGERLTISNWVAAAITAGKIEDPVDLPAWVNAALYAIRNAKGDLGSPVDKDVGF